MQTHRKTPDNAVEMDHGKRDAYACCLKFWAKAGDITIRNTSLSYRMIKQLDISNQSEV
jgi:hypothetical protein